MWNAGPEPGSAGSGPDVSVRHGFRTAVQGPGPDVSVRHGFRTAVHELALRLQEMAHEAVLRAELS